MMVDLEITIDLDKLCRLLVHDALRTKSCRLTRVNGAITVKPVDGTIKITGQGRALGFTPTEKLADTPT
jgi:hypothetical protein